MKYVLTLFFSINILNICFGQMPLQSDKEQHVQTTGFVYFTHDNMLRFVPMKSGRKELNYDSFSSDSVGVGYGLSNEGMNFYVKDAKKFGKEYSVFYMSNDSVRLTIIPVEINYILYPYRWSEEDMKSNTVWEEFDFPDKKVDVTAIGGMSINVISIKPLKGYK